MRTQYWNLLTGSRIAYSLYEPQAGVPVKADPVVFVHGGPGLRTFDTDHAFYRQFTQDGFRVYLFDQVGSGLSGRLLHATDYPVERQVADLEAIRQQIGAERLILIGHSWGGTLIAHYAAAHSEHVAKLIFHSPRGDMELCVRSIGMAANRREGKEGSSSTANIGSYCFVACQLECSGKPADAGRVRRLAACNR